jgi:hypothetical protein
MLLGDETGQLNRHRRLIREERDEVDLVGGELGRHVARHGERSDQAVFASNRNAQERPKPSEAARRPCVLGILTNVADLDHRVLERDASDDALAPYLGRMLKLVGELFRRATVRAGETEGVAITQEDVAPFGAGKLDRPTGDLVQHLCKLGRCLPDRLNDAPNRFDELLRSGRLRLLGGGWAGHHASVGSRHLERKRRA